MQSALLKDTSAGQMLGGFKDSLCNHDATSLTGSQPTDLGSGTTPWQLFCGLTRAARWPIDFDRFYQTWSHHLSQNQAAVHGTQSVCSHMIHTVQVLWPKKTNDHLIKGKYSCRWGCTDGRAYDKVRAHEKGFQNNCLSIANTGFPRLFFYFYWIMILMHQQCEHRLASSELIVVSSLYNVI